MNYNQSKIATENVGLFVENKNLVNNTNKKDVVKNNIAQLLSKQQNKSIIHEPNNCKTTTDEFLKTLKDKNLISPNQINSLRNKIIATK